MYELKGQIVLIKNDLVKRVGVGGNGSVPFPLLQAAGRRFYKLPPGFIFMVRQCRYNKIESLWKEQMLPMNVLIPLILR